MYFTMFPLGGKTLLLQLNLSFMALDTYISHLVLSHIRTDDDDSSNGVKLYKK